MKKKFNATSTKQRIYERASAAAANAANSPAAHTADTVVHCVTTGAGAAGAAAMGAAAGAAAVGTSVALVNWAKPISKSVRANGIGGILGRRKVITTQMGKVVSETTMGGKAATAAAAANGPIVAPTAAVVAVAVAAAISGAATYTRVANAYHRASAQLQEQAYHVNLDIPEEEVAEND